MGSADWMPRNLERRVEILFPVESEKIKSRIITILKLQLKDNRKAHVLLPDGTYEKIDRRGKESFHSQDIFCAQAIKEGEKSRIIASNNRVFIPETRID